MSCEALNLALLQVLSVPGAMGSRQVFFFFSSVNSLIMCHHFQRLLSLPDTHFQSILHGCLWFIFEERCEVNILFLLVSETPSPANHYVNPCDLREGWGCVD